MQIKRVMAIFTLSPRKKLAKVNGGGSSRSKGVEWARYRKYMWLTAGKGNVMTREGIVAATCPNTLIINYMSMGR